MICSEIDMETWKGKLRNEFLSMSRIGEMTLHLIMVIVLWQIFLFVYIGLMFAMDDIENSTSSLYVLYIEPSVMCSSF